MVHPALDTTVRWTAPKTATYRIDTIGSFGGERLTIRLGLCDCTLSSLVACSWEEDPDDELHAYKTIDVVGAEYIFHLSSVATFPG